MRPAIDVPVAVWRERFRRSERNDRVMLLANIFFALANLYATGINGESGGIGDAISVLAAMYSSWKAWDLWTYRIAENKRRYAEWEFTLRKIEALKQARRGGGY